MTGIGRRKALRLLGLLAVGAPLLQACREEDQGRVILFRPGEYRGPPKQRSIDDQRVDELHERAQKQDF